MKKLFKFLLRFICAYILCQILALIILALMSNVPLTSLPIEIIEVLSVISVLNALWFTGYMYIEKLKWAKN